MSARYRALLLLVTLLVAESPLRGQIAVDEGSRGASAPLHRAGIISPDLRWAATLNDTALTLWNTATGDSVWRFPRPPRSMVTYPHRPQLAFSADSRLLAVSPGGAGEIWVLDVPSGRQRAHYIHTRRRRDPAPPGMPMLMDEHPIMALAFSPDGTMLAAVSQLVIAWNLATGDIAWSIQPRREDAMAGYDAAEMIHEIAFDPSGQTLAAVTLSGHTQFYDARTGAPAGRLPVKAPGAISSILFSQDGTLLALASCDRLEIWSMPDRAFVRALDLPRCDLSVTFSPDNRLLVAGTRMAGIRLWDISRGEPVQILYPPAFRHWPLAWRFSPDGHRLMQLSGRGEHRIRTWSIRPR